MPFKYLIQIFSEFVHIDPSSSTTYRFEPNMASRVQTVCLNKEENFAMYPHILSFSTLKFMKHDEVKLLQSG